MFSDDIVDYGSVINSWEKKCLTLEDNYKKLNESYSKQFVELQNIKNENLKLKNDLEAIKKTIKLISGES